MASLKQTIAQVVATRIGKRDFVPGRVLAFQPDNLRTSCSRKLFDFCKGKKRFQFQKICLRQTVRFQNAIGKVSIIRQEDEARGVVFEPSHGKDALRNAVEKIAERAPTFRIAHCRNNFRRLVQQQINPLAFRAKELPGDFDMVARLIRFCAKFGDDAPVERDVPRRDELLRVPPRGDTSARNYFLQSFQHGVPGIDVSGASGLATPPTTA
jgi:hypothetical protein